MADRTAADNNAKRSTLSKNLGFFDCVFLIVGSIIGSGIFISPKGVIQETGSIGLSLIVWFLCGVLSIFGAQSYSELAAIMPRAGGDYEYYLKIYGDLAAFLLIWTLAIVIVPCCVAVAALTFADYTFEIIHPGCVTPYAVRIILSISAISILSLINCLSIKMASLVQKICSIGKLLGLSLLIGFGAYCIVIGRTENFKNPFEDSTTHPGQIAVAFYSGIFSYEGWRCLNNVVEEIKNPNKILPYAIWTGLIIVTMFYLFSNIAYFTLLNPREMIASNAVAVTFAEKLIGSYSWIISVFVALSVFGYLNAVLFHFSRAYYAAARNSHLPSILALVSIKHATPMMSVLFMSATSIICLFFEDIFILINISILPTVLSNGISVIGLLYLRVAKPNLNRPVKISLIFPILFLIFSLGIILMTFLSIPYHSGICILIILSGIPIYYLTRLLKKSSSYQQKKATFYHFVQKLTLSN